MKHLDRSVHRMPACFVMVLASVAALACAAPSSGASPSPAPDFSEYQRLLDDYLVVASQPGAPLETRFHYFKLYDSDGRTERMLSIRAALLSVAPAELEPAQRRAWAINTYNFLVLDLATPNLVSRRVSKYRIAEGVFGVPLNSVRQIKLNGRGFFEVPVAHIDGRDYNLDQFERAFVFDDPGTLRSATRRKAVPKSLDPRAHFALVCGAIGCPPLQPRVFTADSLDVQLDRATRDALAHSNHLRWDSTLGRVSASSVFTWYEADFGGGAKAVEFALHFAPESVRTEAAATPKTRIDRYLPWNWDLNTVPLKPRPARPAPGTP